MSVALLELLRRHRGRWLDMEALQIALQEAPVTIHEYIERLRAMGHEIDARPINGFRLVGSRDRLSSELIEFGLGTHRVGRQVLVYESTGSTNDVAWQYAAETGYDGLVVFAESQSQGRGRMGRSWTASAGQSILCSVLLQSPTELSGPVLSLVAGLTTAIAIETCCGVHVRVKWPNDVVVSGQKIAGTIVESRQMVSKMVYVIGIGINCQQGKEDFPEELAARAMSLRQATGEPVDRAQLAQALLRQIDAWLLLLVDGERERLHADWLARCDDIGCRITVVSNRQEYVGRVIDVSPEQGLVLQLDGGPVKVFDATTTHVKV